VDRIVEFKNHKAYLVRTERKKAKNGRWKDAVTRKKLSSLLRDLQTPIELAKGTKFSDIWAYIEADLDVFNVIFASATGGFSLSEYSAYAKKPVPRGPKPDPNNSMKYLEAFWGADYHGEGEDITIYAGFHGRGPQTYDVGDGTKGKIKDGGWGIDFTPINELMKYEVRLDNVLEITNLYCGDWTGAENIKTLVKGNQVWTVYDLLHAILFEITWHGLPEDQAKESEMLIKRVGEISADLKKEKL
jgi:hypothetical protein